MRISLALMIAGLMTLPLQAQFAITVQQNNGQASAVGNGGSVSLNAPALGQSASATVAITYLGSGTASFPSSGQILGSSGFSATGDTANTLAPFQSTTFTLNYSPSSTALANGEFLWPFTVQSGTGTTTTTESGAIILNLIGTAPNLIVGQITSAGSFQTVASGGTIQFPNTSVNAISTVTVTIANSGTGPGTINSITASGTGFQLAGLPLLPIVVNPGAELNVSVQFQPTSSGTATGSLQIAFASGTYTAVLSGNAVTSLLTYTLTQGGTTSQLIPGQTITLSGTNVGSQSTATVVFQNTSASAVVLNGIGLSGAGFSLTDAPFFPLTLQPQQSNSITITYTPTQAGPSTGRLLIGNDYFTLSAQALGPTLAFSYDANGVTTPVVAGGTLSFSPVVDGQTGSVQFAITNTGTTAATLASIGIVDPAGVFSLTNLPALPAQLAPGAVVRFTVNFSPVGSGLASATLAINNQAFGLTGFSAAPPPLPSFSFTGVSGTQQPFQQPAIGLSLATPYPYPVFGTLTLAVATGNFGADPAVQFSSGGKQVTFSIPANTLKAVFPGGATQIQLQSGTVSGTIRITPTFTAGTATGTDITPANPATLQLTVPAQAPTLLTAAIGTQTATSLSLVMTGFSTTRSLDHLTFQLTPANGVAVSGTSFQVDVTAAAAIWFQSAASVNSGGQFTVEIPFSFAEGSTTAGTNLTKSISAVSVTATNATGTSNSLSVAIP